MIVAFSSPAYVRSGFESFYNPKSDMLIAIAVASCLVFGFSGLVFIADSWRRRAPVEKARSWPAGALVALASVAGVFAVIAPVLLFDGNRDIDAAVGYAYLPPYLALATVWLLLGAVAVIIGVRSVARIIIIGARTIARITAAWPHIVATRLLEWSIGGIIVVMAFSAIVAGLSLAFINGWPEDGAHAGETVLDVRVWVFVAAFAVVGAGSISLVLDWRHAKHRATDSVDTGRAISGVAAVLVFTSLVVLGWSAVIWAAVPQVQPADYEPVITEST